MGVTPAVPSLSTFYVYLTGGCNCACRHCWFVAERGRAAGRDQEFLPLPVLRTAIEQARPLGLAGLKWTGGEPTLHPDFRDFLRLQQESGLTAIMETNGLLIDAELAALMKRCGVTRVSVSLDGAEAATHDAIRGVRGAFARTLDGIAALVQCGYAPELILTLQRANADQLQAFFALARELGAGSVKLNVMQPVLRGEALARAGEGLPIPTLLALQEELDREAQALDLPIQIDLPMAFRSLSSMLAGENDGACNIRHVLGILPGGHYALCGVGQHVPELTMGAVTETALATVWAEHPVLQQVRQELPQGLRGVCGDCLMQALCLGSCVAANYQLSGALTAPYWFCQQAADAGLFPVSRLRRRATD